ncbi:MAG: hypothetical protein ACYDBH_19445 [Acidobacteriaceae bacterium]
MAVSFRGAFRDEFGDHSELLEYVIAAGELDGAHFDWGGMKWEKPR